MTESSQANMQHAQEALHFGLLHTASLLSMVVVFIGYNSFSTLLQYYYYAGKTSPAEVARWKSQYKRTGSLGDHFWWLPVLNLFRAKKDRAPHHWLFCSMNILVAATFIGIAVELVMRGHSKMYWRIDEYGWTYFFLWSTLAPIVYHNIAEYYWHRTMHIPFLYKIVHKFHHYYKSPGMVSFCDPHPSPIEFSWHPARTL